MSKLFWILTVTAWGHFYKSTLASLQLDLNDILRADLMPTTFFMFDGGVTGKSTDTENLSARLGDDELGQYTIPLVPSEIKDTPGNNSSAALPMSSSYSLSTDGNYMNALSTMRFHRNKFNEYQCNNFLASQIMSSILPGSVNQTDFSNRMGLLPHQPSTFNSSASIGVHPRILVDIGSHGYRNWLEKTAAFESANKRNQIDDPDQSIGNLSSLSGAGVEPPRRNDIVDYADYYDGDVSGYAYQKPMVQQPNNVVEHQQQPPTNPYVAINHGIEDFKHQNTDGRRTIHKEEFPVSPTLTYPVGTVFLQPVQQFYTPQMHVIGPGVEEGFSLHDTEYHHHHHVQDYKSGKALGLKEIFEIALTTLAFLAFGMFMLQVIMCITMETGGMDSSMVVTPMEGSAELDPIQEEVRRKRAAPVGNSAKINELAKTILISLDTTYYAAEEDNGQCLFRTLCETNKLSRTAGRNKYWIPLWGLGMTWFSPRLIKTQSRMHSILDGIKASALGLGNANCKQIYSKCNFEQMVQKKEKMRKKRSADFMFDWK